jgi:gluconolactonase
MFILSRFLLLGLLPLPAAAQPVGSVSLPPALASPSAQVRWVQQVPAFCEGPAWDGAGSIWFTEQHGKDTAAWPLWKVDLRGPAPAGSVVLAASGWANGLEFDSQGRLLACRRRSVARLTPTLAFEALADSSAALPFAFANDIAAGSDGSFFFTALDSLLYRVGTDGKAAAADRGHKGLNGVLWAEEAGVLYAGDADSNTVYRFKVAPDGRLSGRKVHVRMRRPDGMCMDEMGNLYVASVAEGRIRAFDPSGDSLGAVLLDPPAPWNAYKRGANGNASNCAFGGEDGRTLFITGDGGLYALPMKVAGRGMPASVSLATLHGPGGRAAAGVTRNRNLLGRDCDRPGGRGTPGDPRGQASGTPRAPRGGLPDLLYLGP